MPRHGRSLLAAALVAAFAACRRLRLKARRQSLRPIRGGSAASSTRSTRARFRTANGDGVGDLEGIRQRLDHLAWLGVDAIWLSPIFPSPMADFGYDVADYCDIDPLFGTLADFDAPARRRARARPSRHARLGAQPHLGPASLVRRVAHVARQPEARLVHLARSRTATADRPTTGSAVFGGRAWTLDEATGQYYFHAFLKEQPDLNWRNPGGARGHARRAALLARPRRRRLPHRRDLTASRRTPSCATIPPNPDFRPDSCRRPRSLTHTTDQPDIHAICARMRQCSTSYAERVLDRRDPGSARPARAPITARRRRAALAFNFQLFDAAVGGADARAI